MHPMRPILEEDHAERIRGVAEGQAECTTYVWPEKQRRSAAERFDYQLSPAESLIYDSKLELFAEEDRMLAERDAERERDRQRRGASNGSF